MNNKAQIIKILDYFASTFPKDDKITPERLEVTAEVLSKYPAAKVKEAMIAGIAQQWEWFPVPAQIAKFINSDPELDANESFERILTHIKRFGSTERMDSLSELEKVALRSIGGLRGLGMSQESDLKWKRKDYVEAFSMYKDNPTYTEDHKILHSRSDELLEAFLK